MSREPNRNVYIGHRYVPLLVGEWDKSIEYEGLSIVTHKGASYTSKKRTPPGIEIENEEFWVLTGNYNAQVEYYREETERVNKKLDEKSDITYVNTELDKKSDKTYVDTELDKKSDKTYVDTELDKKSDKTYVDTELDKKVKKDEIVINIEDYGAKTTNTRNENTEAIVRAIEKAELMGGGHVHVPVGTYKVNPDYIKLSETVRLVGVSKTRWLDGNGSTLDFSGVPGNFGISIEGFETSNKRGQQIESLKIDGDKGIENGILINSYSYNNTLRDIDVFNFKTGIKAMRSWNNIWEKVIVSNSNTGFRFENTSTSSTFTACLSYNCDIGYDISGVLHYSSFMGCGADGGDIGIKVTSPTKNTGFYNFGFENLTTAWEINNQSAMISVHGFYYWEGSTKALKECFNVKSVKNLNIYDVDFTGIEKVFTINKSNVSQSSVRTLNCVGIKNETSLDYVMQDNQPFGFILRHLVSDTVKKFEGTLITNEIESSILTPENGDSAFLTVNAGGNVVNLQVINDNGGINYTVTPSSSEILTTWATPGGRSFAVRLPSTNLVKVSAYVNGSEGSRLGNSTSLPVKQF